MSRGLVARLGWRLAWGSGWVRFALVLPWCLLMAVWDVRRHRPPANDDRGEP